MESFLAELLADEELEFEEMRQKEPQREEKEKTTPVRREGGYDFAERQDVWPNAEDQDGTVRLPPVNEGPDPTKGPLERQVSMSFREAMLKDAVNPDHMNYWFSTPDGGWNTKYRRVKKAEELPGFFATALHRGKGRIPLSALQAGDRLRGVVSEVWYYHGIKIDIGYEYDGLLPMHPESWHRLEYDLRLGLRLDVEVVKIWNKDFYRWPIQLKAVDPNLQRYIIPSSRWDPPVDMRGKTVEEIERHTNRRLPTTPYFVPDDPEKAANPYHDTANVEERYPPPDFDQETLEEIQQDYYDDVMDAFQDMY